MHLTALLSLPLLAAPALAQGDLAGLLASQPDLSTLLELVSLVDGLADTLAAASNITIFAPTNEAFEHVPRDIPEGEAIEQKNDTIAIAALLANHVFQGSYPASAVGEVPTFAQTLLNSTYENYRQPFSNFTGGQYNGLVLNGEDVCVLSGEEGIATVVEADITLGDGIIIHVVDDVIRFGAPLQLFTRRAGLLAMNAAIETADLGLALGNIDVGDEDADHDEDDDSSSQGISDFTIFVPTDEAFEAIGSVLEDADLETLQAVLSHHLIAGSVVFSPSLGNISVPSSQGTDLEFTVLPDGSAWVNNAKIVQPNVILYNGVAHIIDSVLNPADFDRDTVEPAADASDRVAFEDATPVSQLPFTSISYANDPTPYSSPELLRTMAAVATGSASAAEETTAATDDSAGETGSSDAPSAEVSEVAEGAAPRLLAAGPLALGMAVAAVAWIH